MAPYLAMWYGDMLLVGWDLLTSHHELPHHFKVTHGVSLSWCSVLKSDMVLIGFILPNIGNISVRVVIVLI